jgi:hypothetical protein
MGGFCFSHTNCHPHSIRTHAHTYVPRIAQLPQTFKTFLGPPSNPVLPGQAGDFFSFPPREDSVKVSLLWKGTSNLSLLFWLVSQVQSLAGSQMTPLSNPGKERR